MKPGLAILRQENVSHLQRQLLLFIIKHKYVHTSNYWKVLFANHKLI